MVRMLYSFCTLITLGFGTVALAADPPSQSPDPAAIDPAAIEGTWNIVGNGTPGKLEIHVDAQGRVTGSIYRQPIEGRFDPQNGTLVFDRLKPNARLTPLQRWEGRLIATSREPSETSATYLLKGSFKSVAGPDFGRDGVDYAWEGQSVQRPALVADMKQLQGDWILRSVTPCNDRSVTLPESLLQQLGQTRSPSTSSWQIRDNQIVVDGNVVATITNDVDLPDLKSKIGFRDYRLMLLTLPSGKGFFCSYAIGPDKVEIAYPIATSCHRGSGQILYLQRSPEPANR